MSIASTDSCGSEPEESSTAAHTGVRAAESSSPRVGVLVVAYNASSTVAATLARLPETFVETVDHILVCDDASGDDTYEVAVDFKSRATWPLTVVRHQRNLGYGGNQKAGYAWAMEHGLDIVVLLHGDGQYAPEVIEDVVAPLLDGRADASFGSRMLVKGDARRGGMPFYKFLGNRILSTVQNRMTGLRLSEWHSGYRAYRVAALAELDLDGYSDGFDFDTEIILGLHDAGKRIAEVPIPTYYGDEICYVNGMKYAREVTADVAKHWAHERGFGGGVQGTEPDHYALKTEQGSHGVLLQWLREKPRGRVLDVGCFDGRFAEQVALIGHEVVGMDKYHHEGVDGRMESFIEADLNEPLPDTVPHGFDYIVAGDILEHVVEPHELLASLVERLAPDGEILVSIPNFGHWYPRARALSGTFDYDQRGPLDRGHVRFFTRRSMRRLFEGCGLRIIEGSTVGTPFDAIALGAPQVAVAAGAVDRRLIQAWPTLFGYQFLYRLGRE